MFSAHLFDQQGQNSGAKLISQRTQTAFHDPGFHAFEVFGLVLVTSISVFWGTVISGPVGTRIRRMALAIIEERKKNEIGGYCQTRTSVDFEMTLTYPCYSS